MNATIENDHPDYTDGWIASEYNDALSPKISEMVLEAKGGYWIRYVDVTTTTGQQLIRVPPRAIVLSKIEISNSQDPNNLSRLPEVMEGHADLFSSPTSATGMPQCYVLRGDQIWLLPKTDASVYTLRIWFFLRPSHIVPPQDAGRIVSIATNRLSAIMSATPSRYLGGGAFAPTPLASGDRIDIVHPNGWHEVSAYEYVASFISGTSITFAKALPPEVEVGDCVRAAGQSDWAPIPADFHRMLADMVSSKILSQLDNATKAGAIFNDAASDMARFSRLISDRAIEESRTLRPYYGGSMYGRRVGR